MGSYRIEVVGVKSLSSFQTKVTACKNMFCIPVIVSPSIESPFRGLGLKHDRGDSK